MTWLWEFPSSGNQKTLSPKWQTLDLSLAFGWWNDSHVLFGSHTDVEHYHNQNKPWFWDRKILPSLFTLCSQAGAIKTSLASAWVHHTKPTRSHMSTSGDAVTYTLCPSSKQTIFLKVYQSRSVLKLQEEEKKMQNTDLLEFCQRFYTYVNNVWVNNIICMKLQGKLSSNKHSKWRHTFW